MLDDVARQGLVTVLAGQHEDPQRCPRIARFDDIERPAFVRPSQAPRDAARSSFETVFKQRLHNCAHDW